MRFTMLLAALLLLSGTAGAQPPKQAPRKMEELIAEAHRRMNGVFPTKEFQEKIPFSKFLQMLEKEVSKDTPFSIHLDREAFGKDADKMLNAEVNLPPVPARMIAYTALRLALSQANFKVFPEFEFKAEPGAVLITTRDRSLYTTTYDIRDLHKHTHYLYDEMKGIAKRSTDFGGDFPFDPGADPAKADAWIVRQVMAATDTYTAGWHGRKPAGTIQVRNGTKLIVYAAPSIHEEINTYLATLRKLADLAVVIDAKLYALDRADYDEHFAAAFVDPKDKSVRKLLVKASDALVKKLRARKPFMESDADKLRPHVRADFLTLKNAYQYQAGPGDVRPTVAFEGVSFAVKPVVSPDRRCLRLELFQDVNQLVKLTKGKMIDPMTGKVVPIELPNIRKSSTSATVEIHEGQAILLAVNYRMQDKVWLLLAQPMIYMEEEQEAIRKGQIPPAPPFPPAEVEKAPVALPPVPLPNIEEMKQLLQAVVSKILTDADLKAPRDHYGTPGDKRFVLTNGDRLAWPKKFRPEIPGFQIHVVEPYECPSFKPKALGIRPAEYGRFAKNPKGWEVWMEVEIYNAGGTANGVTIRTCPVFFQAKRAGDQWVIECWPRGIWEITEVAPMK